MPPTLRLLRVLQSYVFGRCRNGVSTSVGAKPCFSQFCKADKIPYPATGEDWNWLS